MGEEITKQRQTSPHGKMLTRVETKQCLTDLGTLVQSTVILQRSEELGMKKSAISIRLESNSSKVSC